MATTTNVRRQAKPITGASPTRRKRFRWNWGVILVIPYVLAVLTFAVGPALVALVFSFSDFSAGKPQLFMAGFGNYIKVFSDPSFLKSYWNVIRFSVLATTTGFAGSVAIALLLSLTKDKLGTYARSAFFLPGSITGPALALMFLFMLDPTLSPFNFIFHLFGWNKLTDFVSSSNAIQVMTLIRFYLMSGTWIAIFYAALEGVSVELIEAAKIDGCGPWRLAWDIRRPIIMGFVWFMVIQLISANLNIFGEPYLIATAMGGGSFIDPFWSPNMLGYYYTLTLANFGMSAVISISQITITFASSYFIVTRTGAFTTEVTD
jgi:multiple sugar transport system permease protein